MDSDEDMHDANDLESMDGDFYGGEADDYYNSDDADVDVDVDNYEFVEGADADSDVFSARRHQQNYIILREEDIRQRQEDDIMRVAGILSMPRVAAITLLRHYNWSVSKVHDAWFADEDRVRKAVGLLEKPAVEHPNLRELTCGICFESCPRDKIMSAACGHPFCSTCWEGFV